MGTGLDKQNPCQYLTQAQKGSKDALMSPILLKERGILSSIFSRVDTVRFVSSTLSIQQIPLKLRQDISSRFATLGPIMVQSNTVYSAKILEAGEHEIF